MIYKTDSILEVAFLTVKELAEYLINHINTEVGFTSDTATDVLINDIEPSEWHGIIVMDVFDSRVMAFGYYGTGIDTLYNPIFNEDIYDEFGVKGTVFTIIDYFKKEFNMDINEDYKVCVLASDLGL